MRRFSLGSLAAATLIAFPSGASAATTIGETFDPDFDSCDAGTNLQSVSPGSRYAAPSAGVLTSWSFQADEFPPLSPKLKVARPAPGADLAMDAVFTIVGESALVTPVANQLNTNPIRIPIQLGDVIGLFPGGSGDCTRTTPGYAFHRSFDEDVVPPNTATFSRAPGERQWNVSALLEPDCDNDGFGDETQDPNLDLCRLTCKGQRLTKVGTNGRDDIVGTSNRDVIAALNGNDEVSGLSGNDLLCGGKGKDTLAGGKGKDKLLGQAGKDKLRGGGAEDICKGGKGNDSGKCEVEKSL